MKTSLVSYLVCPVCHKDLIIKNAKKVKDEINEGSLVCPNKHKFAITDGIPRFVVDTTKLNVDEATQKVMSFIKKNKQKAL